MANEPTIIVGKINDKQLKDSIDSLVKHVADGTSKMVANFNQSIETMKNKLKELGSTKVEIGGAASTSASTKRTSEQKKETQAVNESINSYDKLAQAMRRAEMQANRRYSVNDEMINLRTNLHDVEYQLKRLDAQWAKLHPASRGTDKAYNQYLQELQANLEKTRNLMRTALGPENAEKRSFLSAEIERIRNEISKLEQDRARFLGNSAVEGKLKAKYDEITQRIRVMARELQGAETKEISLANAATRYTEEIRRQAQAIRENAKFQKEGVYNVSGLGAKGGDATIYSELKQREMKVKNILSVEEQLYRASQATAREKERQSELARQEAQGEQQATQAAQQQLGVQRQITAEQEKRKKYSTPDTWRGLDVYQALPQYMQRVLGEQTKLVRWDEQTSSLKTLQAAMKQYISVYSQMSAIERQSPFGRQMVSDMKLLETTIKRIQQTMQKPLGLEFINKMPTNTLDAIAEKMRMLASYRSGLDVNKQRNEINQVNAEYDRLKKKMDEVMQKNQQMVNSNTALARSWNYMKNRLAFYFTVGATVSFFKNLAQIRSEYEMNERALGILIDSAERGTQIFNELSQMALVSPYTLIELSAAAKQLTAYDVAAKDVVDTTRRLADMAAAVGIPIERLTYALGQIKAYGYLNARDARMFSNAGIPLVKQLSEYYTELEGHMVSVADVYYRINKKSIGESEVMAVIGRMTDEGGKFFDFQAKMADTLKVRLANLTLAWNNMLNEIGEQSQGVFTTGLGLLRDLFANWQKIQTAIRNVIIAFGALKLAQFAYFAWFAKASNRVGVSFAAQYVMGQKLTTMFKGLGATLKSVFMSGSTYAMLFLFALTSALMHISDVNEQIKRFNNEIRENGKSTYEELSKYLQDSQKLRDSLYTWGTASDGSKIETGTKNIDESEATKVWEAMREQIETSSAASDVYINKLLQIENVSERIRQGFNIIESIKDVNAAFKEMGDKVIVINQDWSKWWNLGLGNDGLAENLRDFSKAIKAVEEEFGKVNVDVIADTFGSSASIIEYREQLKQLRTDLQDTTNSIDAFIAAQKWSADPDKIAETYAKITQKITLDNQLTPEEAFNLQVAIEDARTAAIKDALSERQLSALRAAQETSDAETKLKYEADADMYLEQYNMFENTTARQRVEWARFTNELKERNIHEVREMFRGMEAEDIKHLDFTSGKYQDFVERVVTYYANRHKMTYDEAFNYLKSWVTDANQWSVLIKVFFSVENKSWVDELKGYDSELKKVRDDIKRLKRDLENANTIEERSKAQKELNAALAREQELIKQGAVDMQAEASAAKAAAAANKKRTAAANRAQREAETELQKAFKDELQLIDKVRSQYKKLTDSGVKSGDAINMVTSQFENSIQHINQVLGKNGLPLFDIKAFAGTDNPTQLLQLLNNQLKAAKGAKNVKPVEIKDLEIKVSELVVDAKAYDTKKIADGLNNELGKLKDEYELALELDANPELSDIFNNVLGIDNDTLPQTFGELLDKVNDVARKKFKQLGIENDGFDLLSTIIKPDDDNKFFGLEMESDFVKALISTQKTFRDMFKKNLVASEKILDDYVKKYGDYSDKIAEIEAERLKKIKDLENSYPNFKDRMRPEYDAKMRAIEQGAIREMGAAKFDEFKNSRLYVAMFENLQTVSKATLVSMRARLKDLKDEMGTLSPEQLKQVTQQFEKIDKELVRRNPFKDLVKNVKDYAKALGKEGKAAQTNFLEAQDDYDAQLKIVTKLKKEYEQAKATETDKERISTLAEQLKLEEDKLKFLKEELEKAEALNEQYNMMRRAFKDNADAISKLISVIAANLQALKDFRDYMQETFGVDMGARINAIVDDLAGVGDGLNQITSSAQGGNVFGVITGTVKAVTGIGDAVASIFGDGAARTKKLNKEIEKSTAEIWRLNYAYKELERAINKSLGDAETHARRLAIANKEAELAEVERQLALEKRKRGKDKDADAIKQYQETIQDLRHEIADMKEELITNLLGSDVKSAAEEFVDTWVQAWKAGEATLDAIEEKMSDMIYNLIKKAATSRIVSRLLEPLYNAIDEYTKEGSRGGEELTADEIKDLSDLSERLSVDINNALGAYYGNLKSIGALPNAGKNLSALQQGIQSITEDTAGALEAYMNSVSQQVYLHSDLLTQIRDTVTSFNLDVQVATIGQILMQLQSSYQVQMAIQGIMEGWSTPNGMAVRVELNN